MTSVFSWQNYQPLPCFILYSKAKFSGYSRCFLTSYFCIPVPYNEKDIFFGCQFQKVLQAFIELFNFSFFSITVNQLKEKNQIQKVIRQRKIKFPFLPCPSLFSSLPVLLRGICGTIVCVCVGQFILKYLWRGYIEHYTF